MKKLITSVVMLTSLLFGSQAFAHVGYRSLDALNPFTASVTSDHGWAQGLEPTLANSHDIRWFSFNLTQTSDVTINIANTGAGAFPNYNGAGVQNPDPAKASFTSIGDLDIGFSLYSGLLPAAAFENAAVGGIPVYPAAPGNNGLFDADNNVTMGNNSGVIGTINYIGHKNAGGVGVSESQLFSNLGPGNYSIAVGGAVTGGSNLGIYGVTAGLAVQPVPVPGAVWLFGSAIAGLIGFGRRKQPAA